MLGLGAACAACCAIPLLGVAGGLAAIASALWARADEFVPEAIALGAVAAALAGLWSWRKHRAARSSACGCAPSSSTEVDHAQI
jgi:mercuric ion transport protein